MQRTIIGFLSLLAFLLSSCGRSVSTSVTLDEYDAIEDSVVVSCYTHPEAAFQLIDSLEATGTLLEPQSGYLRALSVYLGLHQLDSALLLCENLNVPETWQEIKDLEMSLHLQLKVYELQAAVGAAMNNPILVSNSASKAIELAHGRPSLRADECDMLSMLGYVQISLGDQNKGIETIRNGITLVAGNNKWRYRFSFLNANANLATSLLNEREYLEAEAAIKQQLEVIDELEAGPDQSLMDILPVMIMAPDYKTLIAQHKMSCYSYLFNIYAHIDQNQAPFWLAKIDSMASQKVVQSTRPEVMVYAYSMLNMYDKAYKLMDDYVDAFVTDTVSRAFHNVLSLKAFLKMQQDKDREAISLMMRRNNLTKQLEARDFAMSMANLQTRDQLRQERARRIDAEKQSKLLKTIVAHSALILALIALIYVGVHFFRLHRKVARLYKDTQHQLTDTQEQLSDAKEQLSDTQEQLTEANEAIEDLRADANEAEKINDSTSKSIHQKIYALAVAAMEEQQLYLRPDFDIQKLADILSTNRTYLSASVNLMRGVNFPTWVSSYRIAYAKKLFAQTPNIRIEDVSVACGFDTLRTFYRQFQKLEGMTPGQYQEMMQMRS